MFCSIIESTWARSVKYHSSFESPEPGATAGLILYVRTCCSASVVVAVGVAPWVKSNVSCSPRGHVCVWT